MDPNKVTQKVAEIINAARDVALESSHQQLTPLHVAFALFNDPEGIARQAVLQVGNEDSLKSVQRVLQKALVRQPSISGADAGEVYMSGDLKKAFQAATKLQKQKGDSFLGEWRLGGGLGKGFGADWGRGRGRGRARRAGGWLMCPLTSPSSPSPADMLPWLPPRPAGADVLFQAILDSKEVAKALEEAGVNKAQLAAAVEEKRGAGNVDSATADQQWDALSKYGVDLTANAAKLDPVIGRDEEIRRTIRVLCRWDCVGGGWCGTAGWRWLVGG